MKIWGSLIILAIVLGGSYIWSNSDPATTITVQEPTSEQLSSTDWFPGPVAQPSKVETDVSVEIVNDYDKDGSYQRSEFGKAWVDTDGNGCDTRNDILARDLTNITVNNKCQVMTGVLESDPYTGHKLDFVRGEGACDKTGWNGAPVIYNGGAGGCSTAVTIDHVISLEEVWYLAARDWSFEKRVEFANDPANLYATGANSWKNSKTPSEVLYDDSKPMTPAGLCSYLSTYKEVVTKYELPITVSTAEAMGYHQTNCV